MCVGQEVLSLQMYKKSYKVQNLHRGDCSEENAEVFKPFKPLDGFAAESLNMGFFLNYGSTRSRDFLPFSHLRERFLAFSGL